MPDEEFEAVMWVCLHKGEGCPELDDVVEFVEEEFDIEIEDEVLDTVYTCDEDIGGYNVQSLSKIMSSRSHYVR